MRAVLSATLAKAEFIARLAPILGDDLKVVDGEAAIIAAVPDADALFLTDFLYTEKVAAAVRACAPRTKWLQLLTAGYDSAKQFGVPPGVAVTNMGDALAAPVATHAVMLLLALQRQLPAFTANQNGRVWDRSVGARATIPDQSTVAVLGFGHIGREIGRLLRAFGARIIAVSRSGTPHALADESVPISRLSEVLPRADAVMVAVPLEATTQNLIGARELNLCKRSAFLVNIARGQIVDGIALVEALATGVIAGAALDVTDPEPLPSNHPLWGAPNLIISPHFAGACGKLGTQRMAGVAEDNLKRFMRGEPLTNTVALCAQPEAAMRITGLETLKADGGWRNFSFLKLSTDEGIIGWSEYNEDFGAPNATSDLIRRFAEVAVGMDPREVGKVGVSLRAITRMSIGGVNHEAIAAIENACLDVKAKALGVPVCALFGGPFRDRVNLYWSHCASFRVWRRDYFERELGQKPLRTLDDIKELGAEVKARGFKALKTNPLPLRPDDPPFSPGFRMVPNFLSRHPDAKLIRSIHEVLAAFRDGAGEDMGLMLDLNFSQRTEGFIRIAKAVEDIKLTWLECDIHDPEALATVRRATSTPIASLETIHGLPAFRPYFEHYACDVAIIDVQWNGLWESVRAAALADAFEVDCAPHNFAGHLASMISAHFCASIPNYRIMEYDVDEVPWRNDLVTHPPQIENGQIVVPTRPGWGTDVYEEAVRAHPPREKK